MSRYEVVAVPMQYAIKVYDHQADPPQSASGCTRYTTSLLLTDLGLKDGRLHFVQGMLTDEINRLIAELLISLGYRRVQFEVPHDTCATRLGRLVESHNGLDRYEVDLRKI